MRYGRYEVIRELGRGAMAVVYLAHDPDIGRAVAVKVLRQDRMENEEIYKRLLKEAKVIGLLSHPHIVAVHDVGQENGKVYIAMEYLDGIPLSEMPQRERLDLEQLVEIGIEIAEALDYAHHKGVVHRDIKPSNIIIQPGSGVKLTDFGVAHVEDASMTVMTQAGEIMGTPAFMSPEQALGNTIDGRSDLFSLGVILYQLSTGSKPFGAAAKNYVSVIDEIIHAHPRDPYEVGPLVPKELSRIIMKALQKDPACRFQSGMEMADALRRCRGRMQPRPNPQPSSGALFAPKIRAAAVAAMLALAMAAAPWFFLNHRTAPASTPKARHSAAAAGDARPPSTVNTVPLVKAALAPPSPPALPLRVKPAPSARDALAPTSSAPARGAPTGAPGHTTEKQKPPRPHNFQESQIERALPPAPLATLPKFAFLKIASVPKGARIYVNNAFKGTTPLSVKLDLGDYRVRFSHPGYRETESRLKLDRMKSYQLFRDLELAE